MSRTSQDVTEAELAILQALWDGGPSTIRAIAGITYPRVGASEYATVQKLLDRLETKGCVERDRADSVHVFRASIDRDELIGRRLRAVADRLCGGSLTPILTHLVRTESLSETERTLLRKLIERGDE